MQVRGNATWRRGRRTSGTGGLKRRSLRGLHPNPHIHVLDLYPGVNRQDAVDDGRVGEKTGQRHQQIPREGRRRAHRAYA